MNYLYQCVILAFALVSFTTATLTKKRLKQLDAIYYRASLAISAHDVSAFRTLLDAHGVDVLEAQHSSVSRCLVADLLHRKPKNIRQFCELFGKYGIALNPAKFYGRGNFLWMPYYGKEVKLEIFQDLVGFGLLGLNDLWLFAVKADLWELFKWLIEQGADLNYRIPHPGYEFMTVAGLCYDEGRSHMLETILKLKIDVNAPVTAICKNHWNLVFWSKGSPCPNALPNIAAETDNLFSLFEKGLIHYLQPFQDRAEMISQMETIIIEELEKRLATDPNYLAKFDTVDEREWTLLDRVSLSFPGYFVRVVRFLRDASLASNLPLSCAYFSMEYDYLRDLVQSGTVNYNEPAYLGERILAHLIRNPSIDADVIEAMIDHGAEVTFPSGSRYSNAYLCAVQGRKDNPLPQALIEKIASKL